MYQALPCRAADIVFVGLCACSIERTRSGIKGDGTRCARNGCVCSVGLMAKRGDGSRLTRLNSENKRSNDGRGRKRPGNVYARTQKSVTGDAPRAPHARLPGHEGKEGEQDSHMITGNIFLLTEQALPCIKAGSSAHHLSIVTRLTLGLDLSGKSSHHTILLHLHSTRERTFLSTGSRPQ